MNLLFMDLPSLQFVSPVVITRITWMSRIFYVVTLNVISCLYVCFLLFNYLFWYVDTFTFTIIYGEFRSYNLHLKLWIRLQCWCDSKENMRAHTHYTATIPFLYGLSQIFSICVSLAICELIHNHCTANGI